VAGKEGRFELRDLAREFPVLTAAAANLGLTGRDAVNSLGAMLQIARKGAGTSSEAANNLANFLQKITSPEAVRNFKEAGVDVAAVLKDAKDKQINPIEAMIQKIGKLTGGDAFKLGALFQDTQVLNFLKPALANTQDYIKVLKLAQQANDGIISQDFKTRSVGVAITLRMVEERVTQIGRRIMLGMAPALRTVEAVLTSVQAAIGRVDAAYPGLIDKGLAWAAGIIAAGAAFAVLSPVLGFIGSALGLLLAPAALAAAAIGAVGYAAYEIWTNWDRLPERFAEIWDGVRKVFADFVRFLDTVTDGAMAGVIARMMGLWRGLRSFFEGLWQGIKDAFDLFFGPILKAIERFEGVRDRLATAGPQVPLTAEERRANFGGRGAAEGFYGPAAALPGAGGELRGRIAIELPDGAKAREVESDRGLAVVPLDRGKMLGRP
jgi:hypothetical protein